MADSPAAVAALIGGHPYGKLALVAWTVRQPSDTSRRNP